MAASSSILPPSSDAVSAGRSRRAKLPTVASALAIICGLAAGCAPSQEGVRAEHPARPGAAPATPSVSDAAFAGAVHALLLSAPGSQQRRTLLAGVVGRQMERALARFRSHEADRGLAAVVGGLYLLRTGELSSETLGPSAREALREAVHEFAVRGDEGRARALYEILVRIAPDAAIKAEVQGHLDALAAWTKDELRAGPPTIATGAVESAGVARSLLEPSVEAKDDAQRATLDWIASAVDLQTKFREKRARPSREEVGEAVRALHSGNDILAQIYLRDADAAGAARALGKSPSRDSIRPELAKAIGALGSNPTAAQWLDVLHVLTPASREREQEEDEVMEDHELIRAATFGIALAAYRLDSTEPESAALVAAVLQDLGLAEASPSVIADAAKAHSDARTVSGALNLVLRAMSLELGANDYDAVRRTYAAAAPLLELAGAKAIAGALSPNAAKVRAMMGDIELEQGSLEVARTLLESAAAEERSGAVLLALARIDRHDDKARAALDALSLAKDAPDASRDPALRGDILLLASDLARDLGDMARVRPPLVEALGVLVKARADGPPAQRARVELTLARVLDRFGAKDKAQQALDRAFDATPHDKRQIASTLGQLVARAFVRRDLVAARDGLRRAIAAELGDDELVYYALWVHLLERSQKKGARDRAQDGAAARVFASIPDDGHWIGKLAAFGAGKLPASKLVDLATTKAEKTEAAFYAAMDARGPDGADAPTVAEGLRTVVRGDGVDLMEASMAREILRAASGEAPIALPTDVKLP